VCGLIASLQTKNSKVGRKKRSLRNMTYLYKILQPPLYLWIG